MADSFQMFTSDFDYNLPPELIAQTPLEPRDSSRLLVLRRATGEIEHQKFGNILDYLVPGDLMVFNQSRVIPARLRGRRADTGGKVELLLLRREGPCVWQALAKPGKRLRPGATVILEPTRAYSGNPAPQDQKDFQVEILDSHPDGIKTVRLDSEDSIGLLGEAPLPPYIHQRLEDPERYQTIYSHEPGSVAAPTAGLHFTESLFQRIKDAGVEVAFVTLHVGLDTFRPVQTEDPLAHKIHTEYFHLDSETAEALNRARQEGRRVLAVGTTSVRVLEQVGRLMDERGDSQLAATTGQADIFILPGHRFKLVDAMITNFHLPKSTLLMLVSAFAGRELVLGAYREAIDHGYRFYSFGDATLIL